MENDLKTFIDPHIKNIFDFKGIDYIKPNLSESKIITGKNSIIKSGRIFSTHYSHKSVNDRDVSGASKTF